VPLNFDFHPRWMREQLAGQGLQVERTRTVSHFRLPLLKRLLPPRLLAAADGAVQWTGQFWQLTPSVFVRARRTAGQAARTPASVPGGRQPPEALFICPACQEHDWEPSPTALRCRACGARWAIDDGIYDFKAPLPPAP
jgi:hypothetical protein